MSQAQTLKVVANALVALQLRVRRLELHAAGKAGVEMPEIKMDAATEKLLTAINEAINGSTEEPEVTNSAPKPAPSPLAEKIAAKKNAEVRETKKDEPAPIVAKVRPEVTNSEGDKYDAMTKEELIRRVVKRNGNPQKIMAPFHARARTIALRVWLRKNPAKKVTNAAPAKKGTKIAALKKTVKKTRSATTRH